VAKFQAAQTAFDQADSSEEFLRVASLFQEIQNTEIVNGHLFYNLGNAYMKAGRRGRAIACYRQALRYRPRDPYVKANLQFGLGSGTPLRGRRKVVDFVLFWQDWIGYRTKFQLAASVGAFALLGGLAGRFFAARRLFYGLSWGLLAVTLILAGSAGYDWVRFEWVERGVIVSDQVEARKGNSESYAPAFNQPLAEGTEFLLLESRGDWRRIRIEGSGEGWIESQWAVTY
jgi:tetratricopeptide (TPR) repeat protein